MEKKEPKIKSSLGITNMNGITTDDDRSCALNEGNKSCYRRIKSQKISVVFP